MADFFPSSVNQSSSIIPTAITHFDPYLLDSVSVPQLFLKTWERVQNKEQPIEILELLKNMGVEHKEIPSFLTDPKNPVLSSWIPYEQAQENIIRFAQEKSKKIKDLTPQQRQKYVMILIAANIAHGGQLYDYFRFLPNGLALRVTNGMNQEYVPTSWEWKSTSASKPARQAYEQDRFGVCWQIMMWWAATVNKLYERGELAVPVILLSLKKNIYNHAMAYHPLMGLQNYGTTIPMQGDFQDGLEEIFGGNFKIFAFTNVKDNERMSSSLILQGPITQAVQNLLHGGILAFSRRDNQSLLMQQVHDAEVDVQVEGIEQGANHTFASHYIYDSLRKDAALKKKNNWRMRVRLDAGVHTEEINKRAGLAVRLSWQKNEYTHELEPVLAYARHESSQEYTAMVGLKYAFKYQTPKHDLLASAQLWANYQESKFLDANTKAASFLGDLRATLGPVLVLNLSHRYALWQNAQHRLRFNNQLETHVIFAQYIFSQATRAFNASLNVKSAKYNGQYAGAEEFMSRLSWQSHLQWNTRLSRGLSVDVLAGIGIQLADYADGQIPVIPQWFLVSRLQYQWGLQQMALQAGTTGVMTFPNGNQIDVRPLGGASIHDRGYYVTLSYGVEPKPNFRLAGFFNVDKTTGQILKLSPQDLNPRSPLDLYQLEGGLHLSIGPSSNPFFSVTASAGNQRILTQAALYM